MQSRRSFIGRMAATVGAVLALPFAGKAAETRITGSHLPGGKHPVFIDVTGKPTPPELVKGVPGVTYLRAKNYDCPPGTKCYLDGAGVPASECDLVAGWVRVFQEKPDGTIAIRELPKFESAAVEFIHFGHVELR